jgi:hypothetical protein
MEESMGNIRQEPFSAIWQSDRAKTIREKVKVCKRNCWMIGTVAPAMKKRPWLPVKWVLEQKLWPRRRAFSCETI